MEAIFSANFKASFSNTTLFSKSLFISPISFASSLLTKSPVRAISKALEKPTSLGNLKEAPPAATNPKVASGNPNFAFFVANLNVAESASSKPPATAIPSINAMDGCGKASKLFKRLLKRIRNSLAFKGLYSFPFTSTPAQKAFPLPFKITTLISLLSFIKSTLS